MFIGAGMCLRHAAGFLRAGCVGTGIRRLFLPLSGKHAVGVAAFVMDMLTVGGDRIAFLTADMTAVMPLHRRHIAAARRVLTMMLTQPVAFRRDGGHGQHSQHHHDAQRQRQKPPHWVCIRPFFHMYRPLSRVFRRLPLPRMIVRHDVRNHSTIPKNKLQYYGTRKFSTWDEYFSGTKKRDERRVFCNVCPPE